MGLTWRLLIASIAALLAVMPVDRAAARDFGSAKIEDAVLTMRTGDHIWRDSGNGQVSMIVSIPMQMAFVYRDGQLIAATTVSTGKRGKETPIGEFRVLEKQVFHRSNLYSNAPMPYMQRLTWTGIALHAGHLPGYPASHGCIRMPAAFAKQLYAITSKGVAVAVVDHVIDFPGARQPIPQPAIEPEPTPLPDDLPAPILLVSADLLTNARYNAVTVKALMVVGPGETLFAPNRAVIQPISARRSRR